jgi:hypothetical protein
MGKRKGCPLFKTARVSPDHGSFLWLPPDAGLSVVTDAEVTDLYNATDALKDRIHSQKGKRPGLASASGTVNCEIGGSGKCRMRGQKSQVRIGIF